MFRAHSFVYGLIVLLLGGCTTYDGLIVLLLGGCTTYGVIDNPPIEKIDLDAGYSWRALAKHRRGDDLVVILSFSGGGTRAAALAYGVLQGLRDTKIDLDSFPVAKAVTALSAVPILFLPV